MDKKKKAQLKKNKKDQEIFQAMRLRSQEAERIENESGARKPKRSAKSSDSEPLWSEKVSSIRNRVTGKKRTSKDRWNRMAGTSDGGGMGL